MGAAKKSLTSILMRDIQWFPRSVHPTSGRIQSGPDWSLSLANAITGDHLLRAVETQTFIKNGVAECAEGIKYDFRMGSQVLKAKFGRPMDMARMSEEQKAEMVIESGEVVFVLTEESLELPDSIMAQLMPKRKLSHEGILVLGGFCVDPLYSGKLLVGLYNFSSSRWVLDPGKKLIAAVFYELQESERGAFQKPDISVTDFPGELVRLISSYQPIDMKSLQENILGLEAQITGLRAEMTTDKEWKKEFQSHLEKLANSVGELVKGLEDEKSNRMLADKEITTEIGTLKVGQAETKTQGKSSYTLLVAILSILITAIVTAGITVLIYWLATRAPH